VIRRTIETRGRTDVNGEVELNRVVGRTALPSPSIGAGYGNYGAGPLTRAAMDENPISQCRFDAKPRTIERGRPAEVDRQI